MGLLLLDRFFLRLEARGWIYWRKVKPKGEGAGLTAFHQLIEPEIRHVTEDRDGRRIVETDRSTPDGSK